MDRRNIVRCNPELKELALVLRRNSTLSEVLLWQQIKNRRLKGYKFLRQKPVDAYIVDFFCLDLMLAVEVDGETHNSKSGRDAARQERLEALGITMLRVLDIDVKRNMEGVLKVIERCIEKLEGERKHPPAPLQGGIINLCNRRSPQTPRDEVKK